jgi:hypothetical protein
MSKNTPDRPTRMATLVRARNRAYSMLAERHREEFDELKNDLLVKWGHEPIDPDRQRRVNIVDSDFPLDEKVTY